MSTNVERVSDELAAAGVTTLFGLMGNGNLDLIADTTGRHGTRYIAVRHENAAVAAADGFARAGGGIGVATVTHGPGFTNALTALETARRARSPLLLIAGNASGYPGRSTQRLDHAAIAHAFGVPTISPTADGDWAKATREALEGTRHGPILLDLPAQAMRAKAVSSPVLPNLQPAPHPVDMNAIADVAARLARAERPLILAGRGAVAAGIRDILVAIGHRFGARLGTTLAAKGLFSGESGDIGLVGGWGSAPSVAACRESDLVLVAGASLNGFTTEHGTLMKAATVLRLDENPNAASTIEVAKTIVGDLAEIVPALARACGSDAREPWPLPAIAPSTSAPLWPLPLLTHLDGRVPEQRTIVFDHGDQANSAVRIFRANDPSQSLFTPDFGSIGLSLAAAIGAAIARPERRTLAVIGDGALMMSLPELDTLKRTAAPVFVIVLNDGAYGAELPHLAALGASTAAATFDSAPISDIARAIGLPALRISEEDSFDEASRFFSEASGPALLEVVCARPDRR